MVIFKKNGGKAKVKHSLDCGIYVDVAVCTVSCCARRNENCSFASL